MPKTDLSRRKALQAGGAAALASTIPLSGCGGSPERAPLLPTSGIPPENPTAAAKHLSEKQYDTLAALVDRLIPEDTDPGAATARCVDHIDAFLAAFQSSPAFIYAGAPYSDRGGHPVNEFQAFIPLDKYEELAWRTVIEGSRGIPEREVNGPVAGLQQTYADGLAHLDSRAQQQGVDCFSELTPSQQDAIITDQTDGAVTGFVGTVFGETIKAMYGAPEYQGNQDLVGWGFTNYDGDVHPRGFTNDQVVNADTPGPFDATLPPSYHEGAANPSAQATVPGVFNPPAFQSNTATLSAYASADEMSFLIADSGGDISKLQELMQNYRTFLQRGA
ncbi:MAG: gluconate 2-dehydrogenase subunit 3 family protein [Gammaproteobacteria bacterium]|nr:gluconate 2-dehydrogenase subunit 3 family protein [Gammaproteobacteria bacterium]